MSPGEVRIVDTIFQVNSRMRTVFLFRTQVYHCAECGNTHGDVFLSPCVLDLDEWKRTKIEPGVDVL